MGSLLSPLVFVGAVPSVSPCSQRAQAESRPRSAERSEGSLDAVEHDGKVRRHQERAQTTT